MKLAVLFLFVFVFWYWASSVVGDSGQPEPVSGPMPTPALIHVTPAAAPTP